MESYNIKPGGGGKGALIESGVLSSTGLALLTTLKDLPKSIPLREQLDNQWKDGKSLDLKLGLLALYPKSIP